MERISQHPIKFLYALILASQHPDARLDPLYRPFILMALTSTAFIRTLMGVAIDASSQIKAWNSAPLFGIEPGSLLAGALAMAFTTMALERREAAIRNEFSWVPTFNTFPENLILFLLALGPAVLGSWLGFRTPGIGLGFFASYFLFLSVVAGAMKALAEPKT
jgi:hypothetical protein